MSGSTLDPDNIPLDEAPIVNRGHGTGALGPSDNSDSGSDVASGSPNEQEDPLGLDRGTNEDPGGGIDSAGADIGDVELDSDTDAGGTGERGAAGRDSAIEGADIGFDHVETVPLVDGGLKEDDFLNGPDEADTPSGHAARARR
jgi:hypothetical protein